MNEIVLFESKDGAVSLPVSVEADTVWLSQEKAANLLYLVTKNHGFSDGNKRIAAGLFLYFLKRNRLLLRKDGSKRIADHTLVALTVMIAESKPQEKELMVNLVMTFLK